jgi:hypothetical protein
MISYPETIYIVHAIENNATFLVKITVVFFALTNPASSIVKPAAIHMTKAPQIRK